MIDLSALGGDTLGTWTRRQALSILSASEVDTLVRQGVWQVLWRGVYADGGFDPSPSQRAWAAVLAAGHREPVQRLPPRTGPIGGAGAAASVQRPPAATRLRAAAAGRTAARVWGWPLVDDDDPATAACEHRSDEVVVARHLPVQHWEGRRLLPQQSRLGPADVVQHPSGPWMTAPARTLLDLAGRLSHEALVCAVDAALHRRQVTVSSLLRIAGPGTRGAPALRRAVAVADKRAEAPTETLARLLLLPVLPGLEPQVELFDVSSRLVARFDLGDRVVRLAVEADGKRNHAGEAMVAKDRQRDRASERLGWCTERVGWFELRRRQAHFVRRVVQRHEALTGRSVS